jgi:hypothetical protein
MRSRTQLLPRSAGSFANGSLDGSTSLALGSSHPDLSVFVNSTGSSDKPLARRRGLAGGPGFNPPASHPAGSVSLVSLVSLVRQYRRGIKARDIAVPRIWGRETLRTYLSFGVPKTLALSAVEPYACFDSQLQFGVGDQRPDISSEPGVYLALRVRYGPGTLTPRAMPPCHSFSRP